MKIKTYGPDDVRKDPDIMKGYPYHFVRDVAFDNDEVFGDNHEVADCMKKMGFPNKSVVMDPELCCFYAYFKSKKAGVSFINKLNRYLNKKLELRNIADNY